MKTIAKYLAIIILTSGTMMTACVSKKKMKASAARIEQLKKDSIATHHKLDTKLATITKKQEVHEKHVVKQETDMPKTVRNPEHFTPLPPSAVDSVFKISYPDAKEIVWTNEIVHNHSEASIEKAYKASFLVQEKRQTVVYAENGKWVEARSEILPDQLPEIVYEAIKKQFPDEQIVAATTYKSTRTNGSYTAVVKSKLHDVEKILIVAENGAIVKH